MNSHRIVASIVSSMVPSGVIERPIGGLALSSGDVQKAWVSASSKLGLGDVPWLPAERVVQAFAQGSDDLEGPERLVAEMVADMAGEAIMSGYHRVSVPVGRFALMRSSCAFCPPKRKLVGLRVEVVADMLQRFRKDAEKIIWAHDISTVEEAYDYLNDDRAHGDDYAADAAQAVWKKTPNEKRESKEVDDIVDFISKVLIFAQNNREKDGNT